MEFIVRVTKEKKKTFASAEVEDLIDYYRENPALWNHNLRDYRDRVFKGNLDV